MLLGDLIDDAMKPYETTMVYGYDVTNARYEREKEKRKTEVDGSTSLSLVTTLPTPFVR